MKRRTAIAAVAIAAAVGLAIAASYIACSWPFDTCPVSENGEAGATPTWEDKLETVATAGILIGGVAALIIATWRGIAADEQAKAAKGQVDTAQHNIRNDRYQQAGAMLGHPVLIARLSALYLLRDLAKEYPDDYYGDVIRICSSFARNPPPDGEADRQSRESGRLRDDVQQAIQVIAQTRNVEWEEQERARTNRRFDPALIGADLSFAYLWEGNLSGARLRDGSLRGARLNGIDLAGADLQGTDVSGTDFSGRSNDLLVLEAEQPQADAKPVRGLTQSQLDKALAHPNNPPILDGVTDAEGCLLSWNGGLWRDKSE